LFTCSPAYYPANWDLKNCDVSSQLDKHNFQFHSFANFADDGDSTSEASIRYQVGNVCCGVDLNAPEVLETKADTVDQPCRRLTATKPHVKAKSIVFGLFGLP